MFVISRFLYWVKYFSIKSSTYTRYKARLSQFVFEFEPIAMKLDDIRVWANQALAHIAWLPPLVYID